MPVEAIALSGVDDRYLDVAEADDLAARLPALSAYRAASADDRAAALVQATADIDSAMPYQGRPYAAGQRLAFPRWNDPAADRAGVGTVWAFDDETATAVVPDDVKQATLHQADAILAGTREARLSAQHDGVVYELTGGVAESYKATPGPGVPTGLCRRAWVLMRRYRLSSGRLA